MSHEITGTILEIHPEQQFASGFSKREFVITTRDKYPQQVKLEFTKERCAQLDNHQPGDPVSVHFDIRGNEYNGRYFVNLQAWRIAPEGSQGEAAPTYPQSQAPAKTASQGRGFNGEDDDGSDIPF